MESHPAGVKREVEMGAHHLCGWEPVGVLSGRRSTEHCASSILHSIMALARSHDFFY